MSNTFYQVILESLLKRSHFTSYFPGRDGNTFRNIWDNVVFMFKPSENVYFQSTFPIRCTFPGNGILKAGVYFPDSVAYDFFSLRASADHWRNSWILNTAGQNAHAGSLLWCHSNTPFFYSIGHIIMPLLTFLPNSLTHLGREALAVPPTLILLIEKLKGYFSNQWAISTNSIRT